MKKLFLAFAAVTLSVCAFAAPPDWALSIDERFPGAFLGLKTWQWLGALVLMIVGLMLHSIARAVAGRILFVREKYSGSPTGEAATRTIRRGAGILGFVLPWFLFLDQLDLPSDSAQKVRIVLEAASILGAVLLLYGIWDAVCDAIAARAKTVANAERLLVPVTRKLVRFVILIAGLLLALGVFGVNITGLLAGVGIGGLVVALAAKDSVENVFGSLTILFDMPFALGDWVKIDKVEGIVEEINLRSTKIRTFEDSMITLPNSNLIKAAVENYGARRYRRQRFLIRLSYANQPQNLERFLTLVRKYLAGVPEVVKDRTVVEINDMTEASVGVLVQCYVEAASFKDEARLRGNLMLAIFRAQKQAKVIFINTPVPPPEELEPEEDEETRKQIEDKDDII